MSDQTTPTLEDLRKRAKELGIEGRSNMDRDELVAAIAHAEDPTLEDLRKRASKLNIAGRSSLNRAELEAAIARAETAAQPLVTPYALAMDAQGARATLEATGELASTGEHDLLTVAEGRAAARNPRALGA